MMTNEMNEEEDYDATDMLVSFLKAVNFFNSQIFLQHKSIPFFSSVKTQQPSVFKKENVCHYFSVYFHSA